MQRLVFTKLVNGPQSHKNNIFFRALQVAYMYQSYMDQLPVGIENPMTILFPRQTRCGLQKFGPSGTVENVDSLCLLAMNSFLDKMYLCMWFWFIIVAFMSVLYALFDISELFRTTVKYHSQTLKMGHLLALKLIKLNVDVITYTAIV